MNDITYTSTVDSRFTISISTNVINSRIYFETRREDEVLGCMSLVKPDAHALAVRVLELTELSNNLVAVDKDELSLLRRIEAGVTSVVDGDYHIMRQHVTKQFGIYNMKKKGIVDEYPTLALAFAALDAAEQKAKEPEMVKCCSYCGCDMHSAESAIFHPREFMEIDVTIAQKVKIRDAYFALNDEMLRKATERNARNIAQAKEAGEK